MTDTAPADPCPVCQEDTAHIDFCPHDRDRLCYRCCGKGRHVPWAGGVA